MVQKCDPVFVNYYLHELDVQSNHTENYCYYKYHHPKYLHNVYDISAKCLNYCPKDCQTVEYNWKTISSDTQIGNEFWYNLTEYKRTTEKALVWESTHPMVVYREEPVMSFTDYMSYTGGLFGLWFGTNGKDLIIWVIESIGFIWVWIRMKYNDHCSRQVLHINRF